MAESLIRFGCVAPRCVATKRSRLPAVAFVRGRPPAPTDARTKSAESQSTRQLFRGGGPTLAEGCSLLDGPAREPQRHSGVAGCFLSELHARGEAQLAVDVGEVGLHGAS